MLRNFVLLSLFFISGLVSAGGILLFFYLVRLAWAAMPWGGPN